MKSVISRLTTSATRSSISRILASGKWHSQPRVIRHYSLSTSAILFKEYSNVDRLYSNAASAAEWHNVPIVSTAYLTSKGSNTPYYGVYWNDNDPMNVMKQLPNPEGKTIFHASIESVLLALRQAIFERKLSKVIVRTESEYLVKVANNYLKIWRENGYVKKDGTEVKHKMEIKDLDDLLNMIDARIVLLPKEDNGFVLGKLKEDPNVAELLKSDNFQDLGLYTPNKEKTNVIFVRGKVTDRGEGFKAAGYGIHFKGNNALDTCGRFSNFPYTPLRTTMYGIIKALEMAKDEGLQNVEIVCDSGIFVKYYKLNWKKRDGTNVANYPLYKQIADLAQEIQASFSYVLESDDHDVNATNLLAEDGLGFPIV